MEWRLVVGGLLLLLLSRFALLATFIERVVWSSEWLRLNLLLGLFQWRHILTSLEGSESFLDRHLARWSLLFLTAFHGVILLFFLGRRLLLVNQFGKVPSHLLIIAEWCGHVILSRRCIELLRGG